MKQDVVLLIEALHKHREIISDAFHQGRVYRTEENNANLERLHHLRILTPDIHDSFQLRASLRDFLRRTLSTDCLFAVGQNFGDLFRRLSYLVDAYTKQKQTGDDYDTQRYEDEICEMNSDIADHIRDEITGLQTLVTTRFGTISGVAEKRQQNEYYLTRARSIAELLQAFHFSDLAEQMAGHLEISHSFRRHLVDQMPIFLTSLSAICHTLSQYLFEFRTIEKRSQLIRTLSHHMHKNPGWQFDEVGERPEPPIWLRMATPLITQTNPDIGFAPQTELLAEIAASIADGPQPMTTRKRDATPVKLQQTDRHLEAPPEPLIKKAARKFFAYASASTAGVSAKQWYRANSSRLPDINARFWLEQVLAHHHRQGPKASWSIVLHGHKDPVFTGNIHIADITIARGNGYRIAMKPQAQETGI